MNAKQRRVRDRRLAAATRAKFELPGGARRTWTQDEFWFIVDVLHVLQCLRVEMEANILEALYPTKIPAPSYGLSPLKWDDERIAAIEASIKKTLAEAELRGELLIMPPGEIKLEVVRTLPELRQIEIKGTFIV